MPAITISNSRPPGMPTATRRAIEPMSEWRLRQRVGGLDRGVELDGIAPLLARTVARAFAAAERYVVIDPGGRQVHHHHAGLGVALEMARVFEAGRADARRQSEIGVVGDRDRLLVILD